MASSVSSQVMTGNEGGYGVSDRRALLMVKNISRTNVESTPSLCLWLGLHQIVLVLRPTGCALSSGLRHASTGCPTLMLQAEIHRGPDLL